MSLNYMELNYSNAQEQVAVSQETQFVSLKKSPVSCDIDKHLVSLDSPLESRFLLAKRVYFPLDESHYLLDKSHFP